jgi:hypothetical protein
MVSMVDSLTVVASIVGSLVVSYLATRDRLRVERDERYDRQEQEWYQSTASLCNQIKWEIELVDPDTDLSDRKDGITLSESGDIESIEHLDELMKSLLKHHADSPPGIDNEFSSDVKRLLFAYLNPPFDPGEEIIFEDISEDLRGKVEEVHDLATSNIKSQRTLERRVRSVLQRSNNQPNE